MRYEHLLGRPYISGSDDCYGIIRNFYQDNFGIELTDYARPDEFWRAGLNLYGDNFYKEGFRLIHIAPHQAQEGDVFGLVIRSPVINHAGVFVGDNKILHHARGRFSEVMPMNGVWRNALSGIFRHEKVKLEKVETKIDLADLLLPHKRRKLDDAGYTPRVL